MKHSPLLIPICSALVLTGCASLDTSSSITDSLNILSPQTPRDDFTQGVRKRLKTAASIEQIAMDLDQYVPVKKLNQSVKQHPTYTQVDTAYQYRLKSKNFVDNPTTVLVSGLIAGYEKSCRNLNGRVLPDTDLPFASRYSVDGRITPAVCYKLGSGEPLFRFYTYDTIGQDPLDKTLRSVVQYPKTTTNDGRWLVDATSNSVYHVGNKIQKASPKLSAKVSMDGRNLKIGYLNFNNTRFDSLPLSCFKTTAKVHDDSILENSPVDEPGRGPMTVHHTYAQTIISVRSGIEAKCLVPDLRSATLYFGNNRLVGAAFNVEPGSAFFKDLKRTVPGLKLVRQTKTEHWYQSKDYEVRHSKRSDLSDPKIISESVNIWSRLQEQEANQYLAAHDFPNYYGLRLGHTTKADLKDVLRNAVQNDLDKKFNTYHVLVNIPIFGFDAFGDSRVILTLKFNEEHRLYEFKISPSQYSTRLPTKTEMENFMGKAFRFAMLTDSYTFEFPPKQSKLLSHHYFNNDYPVEKTGGIPLYSVQLLIRKGESQVEGLVFTNSLALPNT